jgi:hypothetical protein
MLVNETRARATQPAFAEDLTPRSGAGKRSNSSVKAEKCPKIQISVFLEASETKVLS